MSDLTTSSRELEWQVVGALVASPKLFEDYDIPVEYFQDYSKRNFVQGLKSFVLAKVSESDKWEFMARIANKPGYPDLGEILNWECQMAGLSASFHYYLDSLRRRYHAIEARRILSQAIEDLDILGEPLESANKALDELAKLNIQLGSTLENAGDIALSVGCEIETRCSVENASGISTGLECLDNIIGGLKPECLYIIGARPAMGKTALGMQLCDALQKEGPVLACSLEMSKKGLIERHLSMLGRLNQKRVQKGQLNHEELMELWAGIEKWREGNRIFICDQPSQTLEQIRLQAKRLVRQHGSLAGIWVDYIQLMGGSFEREPVREKVMTNSRGLKSLAKEFHCSVIALAQVGRDAAQQGHARAPELHHFAESGALEQDADVVIMLHRPSYYDATVKPGIAELCIRKHRQGETGIAECLFQAEYVRFTDNSLNKYKL